MQLFDLKTSHERHLLGTDVPPTFSWKIASDKAETYQTSWRLCVRNGESIVWDSGVREGEESLFVPYEGPALTSRTRYTWSVEVTDNHGDVAQAETWFETAFLDPDDWKAVWVMAPNRPKKRHKGFGKQAAPTMFRRLFRIPGAVSSARLYATCHGIYQASLNGERVDDREFAPEYTSYDKYLCYQTYDVTKLLHDGDNALGMYVADGWYFCPITAMSGRALSEPHAILYQLEVQLADGTSCQFCSDGSETCSSGPVAFSDLFAGEMYDANKRQPLWDTAGFDDARWKPARKGKRQVANLAAQTDSPVRAVREVPAQRCYLSPKGEHIIDFGQVLAGHVRMHVHTPKGTTVTLEHFEVPDVEGNYFNNILGAAGVGEGCDQKVVFVSDGSETTYEPSFSFQGFRYARVSGLDEVDPRDFTAIAMSSDKVETGSFATSDARLNRLYENTRWSQRSNMLSIPTDCPQREKAGWTGDIGIYATTSLQNEDTTGFLTRWLKSVSADQMKDGAVPMVVPFNKTYQDLSMVLRLAGGLKGNVGIAGWGDACILVPLALYEQTGNLPILQEQYGTMKRWCDFIIRCAARYRGNKKLPKDVDRYLWNTGFHYGEWLIPSRTTSGMSDTEGMKLSVEEGKQYITETYAYLSMRNLSRIAGLLGKTEDETYYADMAQKMRQSFVDGILTPDGRMPVTAMGSYIIPLHHGLVPERFREGFVQEILRMIEENHGCLDTGFLGTPVILDTLCENGCVEAAFDLLFQDRCPSWLYEVDHGATTIWESWITTEPDGSPICISLNHYAFGCVDDWMFRTIGGITPTAPGYKTFRVQPVMDRRISSASRSFESEYGTIRSEWSVSEGTFSLCVTVPPCTTATIVLPSGESFERGSGTYRFGCALPQQG